VKAPYRAYATGNTRDDIIDGSPGRGHIAKHSAHRGGFRCIKAGCVSAVDGAELFCVLHLWTLDNPVLRDAPIFGRVVVL
jgi:hypothetical protein